MVIKYTPNAPTPAAYDPTAVLAQGAAVQSFAAIIGRSLEDYRKRQERSDAAAILSGVNPEAGAFMAAGGEPETMLGAQRLNAYGRATDVEAQGLQQKQDAAQRQREALGAFGAKLPDFLRGDQVDVGGALQYGSALGLDPSDVTPQVSALATEADRRRNDQRMQEQERRMQEQERRSQATAAQTQAEKQAKEGAAREFYSVLANQGKKNVKSVEYRVGDYVDRAYPEEDLSPEQRAALGSLREMKAKRKIVSSGFMPHVLELGQRGGLSMQEVQAAIEANLGTDVSMDDEDFRADVEKIHGAEFDKSLPPVALPKREKPETADWGGGKIPMNAGDPEGPIPESAFAQIQGRARYASRADWKARLPLNTTEGMRAAEQGITDLQSEDFAIVKAQVQQERDDIETDALVEALSAGNWMRAARAVEEQGASLKRERGIQLARKAIAAGKERDFVAQILASFGIDASQKVPDAGR